MYGAALPTTGLAGLMILGHTFGLGSLVVAGIGLVGMGVIAYRYGSRVVRRNRVAR